MRVEVRCEVEVKQKWLEQTPQVIWIYQLGTTSPSIHTQHGTTAARSVDPNGSSLQSVKAAASVVAIAAPFTGGGGGFGREGGKDRRKGVSEGPTEYEAYAGRGVDC